MQIYQIITIWNKFKRIIFTRSHKKADANRSHSSTLAADERPPCPCSPPCKPDVKPTQAKASQISPKRKPNVSQCKLFARFVLCAAHSPTPPNPLKLKGFHHQPTNHTLHASFCGPYFNGLLRDCLHKDIFIIDTDAKAVLQRLAPVIGIDPTRRTQRPIQGKTAYILNGHITLIEAFAHEIDLSQL